MSPTWYGQRLDPEGPPVDQLIHDRYFRGVRDKVALECGATDGLLEISTYYFERNRGWRCINIEPVPYLFEQLERNRPRSTNVNRALSDRSGEVVFSHAVHPVHGRLFGNGSLTHTPEHLVDLHQQGCTFERFEVQTVTFAELVEQLGITALDLMVLDVEGHELQAIRGMHGSAALPRVLCVEHTMVGREALADALAPLGYAHDHSFVNNSYFLREA